MCVRAEALTWQHALFAVESAGRTLYLLRDQRDAGSFLDDFDAGLLDEELHELIERPPHTRLTRRRARRSISKVPTGTLVGIENEFSIFDGDERADFRRLIHGLPIDGVRADPSDPNAYRCAWGGVITCDGREAEIAIPPVDVGPGFTNRVLEHSERGETTLRALLPDLRLEGYSTHVSVSLTARDDRRLARRYAQTFAPALMLLMDRISSPGLLVRPRPGRLELCGEYVDGVAGRGVVAFAVGSVRALVRADRRALAGLRVRVRLEPAVERYGLYVDRRAFGPDLYESGRSSMLVQARVRRPRAAQDQLADAWAIARATLTEDADASDLEATDAMVRGDIPLSCEAGS
jgi:hypothetical protein